MREVGLVLITAFFVSVAWAIFVSRLNKEVRSAAQEARDQLESALERAASAENVANDLHAKVVRAEAALNSDADLASAAQAARIILWTEVRHQGEEREPAIARAVPG